MHRDGHLQWRAVWCAIGLSVFAIPVSAAELLPSAVTATQWDGFYVGGQLGGAWGDTDWH
jgi:hypothetical protein